MLSSFFSRRRLDFDDEPDDAEEELPRFVSGGFHSVRPHMLFPMW
jgi:hypothetical protein